MKNEQLDMGARIVQPVIMGMFYWGIACLLGVAGLTLYNIALLPLTLIH